MEQGTKVCNRCDVRKPLGEFYVRQNRCSAHLQPCKACFGELRRERDGNARVGRKCLACDAPIAPETNLQRKHCSSACYHWSREHPPEQKRLPMVDRTCLACDAVIPADADRKRKYCSDRCKGRHKTIAGQKRLPRTGRVCGYEGCRKSLDHRRIDVKYCDSLCYSRGIAGRPALSATVMCQECGDPFIPIDFVRWKYCSKACGQRHGQRVWRANNKLYMRLAAHDRRNQLRENPSTVAVLERDWRRLVNRYSGCCAYCGERTPNPDMDHVVPVSRGGRGGIGNTLPACRTCNISKHALLLMEWRIGSRKRGQRRIGGRFVGIGSVPPVTTERAPCLLCGKTPAILVKGCCKSCYVYKLHHPDYERDPDFRKCPTCGAELGAKRNRKAVYCNQQCRNWYVRHVTEMKPPETRECAYCGDMFTGRRLDAIYCSRKCKGRASAGVECRFRVPSKCPACGELFEVLSGRQRYCLDLECLAERKRQYARDYIQRQRKLAVI